MNGVGSAFNSAFKEIEACLEYISEIGLISRIKQCTIIILFIGEVVFVYCCRPSNLANEYAKKRLKYSYMFYTLYIFYECIIFEPNRMIL